MHINRAIPRYLKDIPYAIVDSGMNIFFGNTDFLNLLGDHTKRSVFSLFCDDDVSKIRSLLDKATVDKEMTFFSNIYLNNDFTNPIPAYINIRGFNEKIPQSVDFEMIGDLLFELIIYKLDDLSKKMSSIYYDMRKQHLLLSLKYTLSFEYDPSTDDLKIYWISNQQNISFFDGTLEYFYNDSLKQDSIASEDLSAFNNFYNSLKNVASIFKHKFRTNYFSNNSLSETYWVTGTTISDMNGKKYVIGILSLYNEVTKNIQDYMFEEMYLDPLTNILSKKHITEYAEQLISKNPNHNICVCIVDIDNFKSVNDTFGHSFGDEVLKASAQVLIESAGTKGVPGRIGGDEFILILDDVKNESELRNVLRNIGHGLMWLFPEQLSQLQFGCSIGVASYPKDANNYNDLFHIADKCVYIAKSKGKKRYIIYDKDFHGEYSPHEKTLVLRNTKLERTGNSLLIGIFLNTLYQKGKAGLDSFLKEIGTLLNFDRIQIFTGKDLLSYKSYVADPEKIQPVKQAKYAFVPDYIGLFLQQHLVVIPNVYNLEYSNHQIFNYFCEDHTVSSYQYIFQNEQGHITALLSFDFCFKDHSIMSDIISDYIIIVSNAIENLIK